MKTFSTISSRWHVALPVSLLTCFLLIYPFHKGLFVSSVFTFEGPLYGAMIFLSLTFAVFAALHMNRFVQPSIAHSEGKRKLWTSWMNNPVLRQLSPLAVLLLPLSYLLSTLNAASRHSAIISFLIWLVYALVFLMAYYLARDAWGRTWLAGSIALSGTVLVIFGFMNYFGDASLWGLIRYTGKSGAVSDTYNLAVEYGASGLRLTSVFQYANSYAAFLIGLFLLLMGLVLHARNRYAVIAAALPVVPALLSLLLTMSRGAYLVLPVAALLFMAVLTVRRQLLFILLSLVAGLLALALYNPIYRIGLTAVTEGFSPQLPLKGWGLLLPASAAFAAFAFAMERFVSPGLESFLERRLQFRGRQMLLPAAGMALGIAAALLLFGNTGFVKLLPSALEDRIASINLNQHSLLERWTFYRDIFKMIMDYPLIGAGGGAWAVLYERYQNNPYTSNDPHSFYLQYALDTGVIGFLIFAFFLITVFVVVVRQGYRLGFAWDTATPACLGLLFGLGVHSAIDLDMNYMYFGILFFLSLGVLFNNNEIGDPPVAVTPDRRTRKQARHLAGQLTIRTRWISRSIAVCGIVIALSLTLVSQQRLSAHNLFYGVMMEANDSEVDFEEFDTKLQQALAKVPRHPAYLSQRAALLIQVYESTRDEQLAAEAEAILNRLQQTEPHRKDTLMLQIRLSLARGLQEQALRLTETGLAMFPWDMSLYERAYDLHYELGTAAAQSGDDGAKRRHWDAIRHWHNVIQDRMAHLATLPEGQMQGKSFELTERMKEIWAEVQE